MSGPRWWNELCAGYLRWLTRRGRRRNTLTAYRFELQAFARWLELDAIASAEQLTGRHIEDFQDWRAGQVISSTQKVAASALRGLLRWAASQEPPLVTPSLWFRVTTPRRPRLLPRPIPRADLEKILVALAPSPPPRDLMRLRTRAMFLLILSSGARISEALSLDRGQLQGRTGKVIQKGGDEKLLVISAAAESAIADYLEARADSCVALFVGHAVQQLVPKRLNKKSSQVDFDHLCEDLGIARFTAHQVRHSCATMLLRQGVDSLVIAKHLGQRGLASIDGYAEVGLDARHEMLEQLDVWIRKAS